MREILFRGKRVDNGEWVYGGVTKSYKGYAVILGVDMTSKNLVTAETVGQYTGLTDKNGKKIFEGDIIRFDVDLDGDGIILTEYLLVCYDESIAGFLGRSNETDDKEGLEFANECVIVTNSHDNPEFMYMVSKKLLRGQSDGSR